MVNIMRIRFLFSGPKLVAIHHKSSFQLFPRAECNIELLLTLDFEGKYIKIV